MRTDTVRAARRASFLAAAAILTTTLFGGSALADACSKQPGTSITIPDCEVQVQYPVEYGGWDTKSWAYYCKGDHPFFWGIGWLPRSFTLNSSCFEATENGFAEDDGKNDKFDATFTNWCFKKETLIVSLACSTQDPSKQNLAE